MVRYRVMMLIKTSKIQYERTARDPLCSRIPLENVVCASRPPQRDARARAECRRAPVPSQTPERSAPAPSSPLPAQHGQLRNILT